MVKITIDGKEVAAQDVTLPDKVVKAIILTIDGN